MTIKHSISVVCVSILFFIFSCKSTKVNGSGKLNTKISAKEIIKNNNKSKSNFSTLVSRVRIELFEGSSSQAYSFSLRMEKDKTIWMSKLGIVKAIITPNRVAFYNKFDNTYFDGDFEYLSNLLGTELDFKKVQSLLLGESLYDLNENEYEASVHEKSYMLAPKNQQDLFELFLLFNPEHFKMDSQQVTQETEGRHLEVNYKTYQTIEAEILPETIKVNALQKDESLVVNLEFKNIELNKKLSYPFKIPSGFEPIVLD